jgi:hypothetical protein
MALAASSESGRAQAAPLRQELLLLRAAAASIAAAAGGRLATKQTRRMLPLSVPASARLSTTPDADVGRSRPRLRFLLSMRRGAGLTPHAERCPCSVRCGAQRASADYATCARPSNRASRREALLRQRPQRGRGQGATCALLGCAERRGRARREARSASGPPAAAAAACRCVGCRQVPLPPASPPPPPARLLIRLAVAPARQAFASRHWPLLLPRRRQQARARRVALCSPARCDPERCCCACYLSRTLLLLRAGHIALAPSPATLGMAPTLTGLPGPPMSAGVRSRSRSSSASSNVAPRSGGPLPASATQQPQSGTSGEGMRRGRVRTLSVSGSMSVPHFLRPSGSPLRARFSRWAAKHLNFYVSVLRSAWETRDVRCRR